MKNILCAALILFGAVGVLAQERTISKEEFDAALKNPNRIAAFVWKGKTWRMTITSETKAEGKKPVDSSTKSISEFAPWQTSRTISEIRTGSKITKSEKIRIGDKIYKRNENEAWTVDPFEEKPPSQRAGTAATAAPADGKIERQYEYKYLGNEMLNDQTTNVYVEILKTKTLDPSTNLERVFTHTNKYWFNEDGTQLKEERVMEGRIESGTFYNRLTMLYELDQNIKIEAPVIDSSASPNK